MKNEYVLGLDIGIASVGWGIVEKESNEIVDCGVRLFDSADASKNEERRGYRGGRRLTRRRKNRLEDLKRFFELYQLRTPDSINLNPLELRVKGLEEQLSVEELYAALYNLVKHRGVSYLEDQIDGEDKAGASGIELNLQELKNKTPGQIQLERYNETGQFRGLQVLHEQTLVNTFTTGAYVKEATRILEMQMSYFNFIDESFINGYVEILTRKRDYYIGPGNKLSRTNYGVYKVNGTTLKNLFDELRGKCSIFSGKEGIEACKRASVASYSAQYFNALNDLCNIKVDGNKLTQAEKETILKELINSSKKPNFFKLLKKLFGYEESSISGYRIDRDGKLEVHSFETYRTMRNFLTERNIDIESYKKDTLDYICDILTLNTETASILEYFNDENEVGYRLVRDLSNLEKEAFIEFRRKKGSYFNKWHSFSYKAMDILILEMLDTGNEQHTAINNLRLIKTNETKYKDLKQFPIEEVLDEIYNPVVRRSIRQSLLIVNALIKKYGDFSDIVIELAREDNDEDRKNSIKKMNKDNEELKKKALEFAGIEPTQTDYKNNKQLPLKLKLLFRQDGKCLYSGEKIDSEQLIKNPTAYEIDHIIPLSISFNDSQSNKVLVKNVENQNKGQQTPYQYFKSKTGSWNYEAYKSYVLDLFDKKRINSKTKDNLLFELDITKQDVIKGFISRNLNDTRYASKVVLNSLQSFFAAKGRLTKVKVINGSFTHMFRKRMVKLQKDRDKNYAHHGIDALVCCYSIINLDKFKDKKIDLETGEILDKEAFSKLSQDTLIYLPLNVVRDRLIDAEKNMKFSHKVDKKVNRSLSDATIYGTRKVEGKDYVVSKIKDIYNDAEYERLKKMIDKDPSKFLMYQHDKKSWEELMKVINMYPDEKNPFKKYKSEFGPFRKYSKKGNGPEIVQLKYIDGAFKSGIDISHKYQAKNKVVLLSLKPFRSDVYYDRNNDCFNLVPIKYSDFKFDNGDYQLPLNRYDELLANEGLLKGGQTLKELEENGHEFCFSLYKNDIFEMDEVEETPPVKWRFLAKNHANKNYFEVKSTCETLTGQKHVGLTKKIKSVTKINTDILGYEHRIKKEKLKLKFKLDNDKI